MAVDWTFVARLGEPIIGAVAGWLLKGYSDRSSKLIAPYGHVSDFYLPATESSAAISPRMHSVVIRNVGPKKANNVRITHSYLPDFHIFRAVTHRVEDLPGGGKQIRIDSIVPDEQLTINYLY